MTEREEFPEPRLRDHGRNVIEAVVASVPYVGGVGAELLAFYMPASLERRRDRWFRLLDERLADVEDRVLNDEAFHTLVLAASRAALGTHLEDKLRLLADALRSSADVIGRGEDGFMAMRSLEWVDALEPLHFEILGALHDEEGWRPNIPWQDVLDRVPVEDDAWYEAIEDLAARRLVGTTGYNPEVPTSEYKGELIWVTARGAQFARFVRLMVDDH